MKYVLVVLHFAFMPGQTPDPPSRVVLPDFEQCLANAMQAAAMPGTSAVCVPFTLKS